MGHSPPTTTTLLATRSCYSRARSRRTGAGSSPTMRAGVRRARPRGRRRASGSSRAPRAGSRREELGASKDFVPGGGFRVLSPPVAAPHLFALVAVAPRVAGALSLGDSRGSCERGVRRREGRRRIVLRRESRRSGRTAELRAEFWALDGDVATVLLFAGAAAATASNVKHLAQSVQERRAELAVRDRVIKPRHFRGGLSGLI